MTDAAVKDLLDQFQRSFHMVDEDIEKFDSTGWTRGLSLFQTPVVQAMHLFDCLDYYFCGCPGEVYQWGHHFGGGWWELPQSCWPNPGQVLVYSCGLKERVEVELSQCSDADLLLPYTLDDHAATRLGHYVYALRHTMHHHGQLSAILVWQGKEGGSWA